MNPIKFSSCVVTGSYSTPALKLSAGFDSYFQFSGRVYKLVSLTQTKGRYEVMQAHESSNIPLNILKAVSFLTGVIPLIMLIGKLVCRSQHQFFVKVKEKPVSESDIKITTINKNKVQSSKKDTSPKHTKPSLKTEKSNTVELHGQPLLNKIESQHENFLKKQNEQKIKAIEEIEKIKSAYKNRRELLLKEELRLKEEIKNIENEEDKKIKVQEEKLLKTNNNLVKSLIDAAKISKQLKLSAKEKELISVEVEKKCAINCFELSMQLQLNLAYEDKNEKQNILNFLASEFPEAKLS